MLTAVKRPIWPLLALAVLLVSTVGAQPQRFALAIVRLDGRLVPFASYDGTRWEKAWPETVEWTPAKPTLDAVPSVWHRRGERVPDRWQVWRTGSPIAIEARVTGAEVAQAHCERQIFLNTDLPEAKIKHPVDVAIEGRGGVAVDSSSVAVAAIEGLRPSAAGWRAAERAVLASFSTLEGAQAKADGVQPPRETPVPVVQVTAVHGQARTPGSPLYVVAEKKYRSALYPQDPLCAARTIMTGWLLADAGAWTLRNTRVWLTDCDLKEPRTALPLAALRVSGRLFWVLQEHGYESETYVLAEVGPSEVRYRIEVNGGGC